MYANEQSRHALGPKQNAFNGIGRVITFVPFINSLIRSDLISILVKGASDEELFFFRMDWISRLAPRHVHFENVHLCVLAFLNRHENSSSLRHVSDIKPSIYRRREIQPLTQTDFSGNIFTRIHQGWKSGPWKVKWRVWKRWSWGACPYVETPRKREHNRELTIRTDQRILDINKAFTVLPYSVVYSLALSGYWLIYKGS